MHIQRAKSIPQAVRRVYDALRANDPIGMAEAYALKGQMATQYDAQIARSLGFQSEMAPVVATGAVGILRLHAYELSFIKVEDTDIVSVTESNGKLDVVSRWSIELQQTGLEYEGFCRQRWILDRTGRRLLKGESFCGLLPAHATLVAS